MLVHGKVPGVRAGADAGGVLPHQQGAHLLWPRGLHRLCEGQGVNTAHPGLPSLLMGFALPS